MTTTPHPEAVAAATEIEGKRFDELIAKHAAIITRRYEKKIREFESECSANQRRGFEIDDLRSRLQRAVEACKAADGCVFEHDRDCYRQLPSPDDDPLDCDYKCRCGAAEAEAKIAAVLAENKELIQ